MLIEFPRIFSNLKIAVSDYAKTDIGKNVLGNRIPNVSEIYSDSVTQFPSITVEEKSNTALSKNREIDSSETLSKLMYEINIYDNLKNDLTNKVQVCYELAKVVNDYFMSITIQNMRFVRIMCEPIPNTANAEIYRILLRFENKNKNIN